MAIVAQRGSGKTHLAAVLVEELLKRGLPVVVVDPMGVFWGLRANADGTGDGFPIPIFGGRRGDDPIEKNSGRAVAAWVTQDRPPRSAVLDLSGLETDDQQGFVADFLKELFRTNREPLHVIVDEADIFAPQRSHGRARKSLGAMDAHVRRGRVLGLGMTMITQRPAVLNKDVLSQVQALVMMRLVAPNDLEAVRKWIEAQADQAKGREVTSSLSSLPVGGAWVWSPGWLEPALRRVKVRGRETWDASSTPQVGMPARSPERMAPVPPIALLERPTKKTAAKPGRGRRPKKEGSKKPRRSRKEGSKKED